MGVPKPHPRQLLLDSEPDEAFDRLTKLAARFLRVPVSLVSVLDENRQFFKSQCGLPEPAASLRETPLTHSFCQHVAAQAKPLVVEDAREHPVVRDNLAVRDLGVIAYLGVPLFDDEGRAYAALCAIDIQPRKWTSEDIEFMEAVAAQVMTEIALLGIVGQLTQEQEKHEKIEQDRALAVRADRHDLRTPLNALLMGMQALRLVGELNEEQSEFIDLAERNAKTLARMIDQMLDIVSVEGRGEGALAKRVASPLELLAPAIEQVAALAHEKRQSLKTSVETNRTLLVDTDKVVRVIVNLLGNAIKFTPDSGQISLTVSDFVGDHGAGVCFSIRDSGIGICESDMGRVFAEGFRVDQGAPTRRSTGLGLTFCKRIVEAHAGRIWVESKPGSGSAFSFVVPTH